MPLPPSHVEAGLHLVHGTLDGRVADTPQKTKRFWWAATTTVLAGRLSECVQQEASVSQALASCLHLNGKSEDEVKSHSCVNVAERTSTQVSRSRVDPGTRKLGAQFRTPSRKLSTSTHDRRLNFFMLQTSTIAVPKLFICSCLFSGFRVQTVATAVHATGDVDSTLDPTHTHTHPFSVVCHI